MVLAMFIYERVFARSVKKSKKNPTTFLLHLKNKDHTINNTLFLCITTGIFFILSLKRSFSNYETIILLISVTHLPFFNAIVLFRKICKTLDITYKMENHKLPAEHYIITEWSGTQN